MSLAGVIAGGLHGFEHELDRFAIRRQARREAALVADAGGEAALLQQRRAARGTSRRRRAAPSANVGRPSGITMNSWKSTFVSACAPPLRMFIIGTGSSGPPARAAGGHERREVLVERHARAAAAARARRHRHAEHGVGAEAAEVRRAVERDQLRRRRAR